MGISKAAIYSSAVILALFMGAPAQAQGIPNKGVSASAPGNQLTKPPLAPGHNKLEGQKSAKTVALGFENPNKELKPISK
jgi:hypothetical protein